MRIAIDIDSVLADIMASLIPVLNQKPGINIRFSDINHWDYPINNKSIGEYIKSYFSDPAFVLSIPEVKGAREAMRELYDKHDIIIASGRPNFCRNYTIHWLENRFKYDNIVFSKEKTIQKLNAEVLVDDSPGYLSKFIKSGGQGILFKQPWNENFIPEGCNFVANGWESVLSLIKLIES